MQLSNLCEDYSQLNENLRTSIDKYDEFYEVARESYVSFVNFSPQIKQYMQKVDNWLLEYSYFLDNEFRFESIRQ